MSVAPEQIVDLALREVNEIVRVAAAGLVQSNLEAAKALQGVYIALNRKQPEIRDAVMKKVDAL